MIGTQIGNYRIVEKLGEGGMGVVYKGVDVFLDRPVAIKVLGPDLARNPELVERFKAEAKAQANLNHTNLATLFAFLVQDGNAVMVMEYVDGETFDQMIQRRGPIPSQEAIPLFKQALLGISVAHRAGIIHRDIKPSNLMLRRDGIVKVMDFGIAKLLGTRGLTRTGTQMGTVAYMSPEQIQNRGVDIRSDIYALGVTLYEMLSGHIPFESDSDFQIMHDHVASPPPLPTRYYPYIPKGIENVVLRSLEKSPEARFQTVEEFGAALEHPDSVPPPSWVGMPAPPPQARMTVLEGTAPNLPYAGPTASGAVTTGAPTGPLVPGTGQHGTILATPLPGTPTGQWPAVEGQPVEPQPAPKPSFLANRPLVGAIAGVVILLVAFGVYRTLQTPPPKPPPPPPQNSNVTLPSGPTTPQSGQEIQVASGGGIIEQGDTTPAPAPAKPEPAPAKKPAAAPETPGRAPAQQSQQQAAVQQMLQNAGAAFEAGRLIEPVDNNAIHYARLVRQVDPNNATAARLEQRVFNLEYQIVRNLATQGESREASRQLTILMQYFPNNQSLLQLQDSIQQAANVTPPPQVQTPVQPSVVPTPTNVNFVTAAYHRHKFGREIGYCEGYLTISPNGGVNYSCRVAHDQTGCHNLNDQLSDFKKVNVFTEGTYAVLHLEKGRLVKWDFYAPQNVYNALNAAVNAAQGAH
ncbi:MAG TPA: protein kinase [Terriglobia bacterium]|nr:protein kinase [Terriglobia bacterium]